MPKATFHDDPLKYVGEFYYSENGLNRTMNKTECSINQAINKAQMKEIFVDL